jgi:hypothetical protein
VLEEEYTCLISWLEASIISFSAGGGTYLSNILVTARIISLSAGGEHTCLISWLEARIISFSAGGGTYLSNILVRG